MRVLLFVQTGDARPKCVKQFGSDRARGLQYLGHLVRPEDGRWLYWLVECANATDGRVLIADTLYRPSEVLQSEAWEWIRKLPSVGRPAGRILASGGRR